MMLLFGYIWLFGRSHTSTLSPSAILCHVQGDIRTFTQSLFPNLSSRQNPESRTSPVITSWPNTRHWPGSVPTSLSGAMPISTQRTNWWDCYTSFLRRHHIRAVLVLKGVDGCFSPVTKIQNCELWILYHFNLNLVRSLGSMLFLSKTSCHKVSTSKHQLQTQRIIENLRTCLEDHPS